MVRDFTQATKDRLSNEIDDINKKTWSPVTDFIGDLFLYGGKWIGLLSLNEDMSNVESYQRRVLDMTDMTKKELNDIFDKVYGIDKSYQGNFSKLNDRMENFNGKIQYLYSVIKPDFCICSASTILTGTSAFNEKLKVLDKQINESYIKALDWAAKEAALKTTKGIFGSALKAVVDIFTLPVSMIKNVATGNPLGIISDTLSIINDVFAVGSNLVGLAALGIGYGISALTGSNETKHMAIQSAEAFGGSTGLTDVLKAEQETNGESAATNVLLKTSQAVDNASVAVDLFNTSKGFLDDPSSMIDLKSGFKTGLGDLNEAEVIGDYQKWNTLYKTMGKKTKYTTLKNISKGYSYTSSLWDLQDGADAAAESFVKTAAESSNPWLKAMGDSYEVGENLWESSGEEMFDMLMKNNSVQGAAGAW